MTEIVNYFKVDPTLRIIILVIAGFLLFIVLPQFYDSMSELGKAIIDGRILWFMIFAVGLFLASAEIGMGSEP